MNKIIQMERIFKVMQYIENNLESEMNVSLLSDIACYSEYHFHRLFRAYCGESIYSYKKRLLLEQSVKHLKYSDDSITEIAFKCGYDNQASFNKAFKKAFSCSPSQARNQLVCINRDEIIINQNGIVSMKPDIIEIEAIHTISVRAVGGYAQAAAEAWGKLMQFAYSKKQMHKNVKRIGVSHDDPDLTETNRIRYDACIDVEMSEELEMGLHRRVIAGGKYAKFLHTGSYDNLQNTYSYIFNDWLPDSGYKLIDNPPFEHYLNKDPRRTKPENLKTEIYIPIV
ncbi:AraC family transcriptional regulator [Photobacterium nomapromontoriensis]|uniref:AraC family transcriptional regulator n=1 Tax=Photobacterium nomapromontoriensis TaxID=2910237 RepID=UPI003D0E621D